VLQKFPFKGLKIDRSFVTNVDSSPRDLGLVRAMLSMATALELATTAEGIETEGQLRCLMNLGCTRGQGYLLGRPEPAEDATRRLGLSR
jgi:EAL domain-containing protein (putative c-di-GMP-specific phosphodiesterase class I)